MRSQVIEKPMDLVFTQLDCKWRQDGIGEKWVAVHEPATLRPFINLTFLPVFPPYFPSREFLLFKSSVSIKLLHLWVPLFTNSLLGWFPLAIFHSAILKGFENYFLGTVLMNQLLLSLCRSRIIWNIYVLTHGALLHIQTALVDSLSHPVSFYFGEYYNSTFMRGNMKVSPSPDRSTTCVHLPLFSS